MIKIVDYGLGNISAFRNLYKRLNIEVGTARTAEDLRGATKLILPGVGAFDRAIACLDHSQLRPALEALVLERHVPLLGVCVGMQMLTRGSEEGRARGLGWISADVRGFASLPGVDLVIPHMGWNDVQPMGDSPLFKGLEPSAQFYFLHSYYVVCDDSRDVAGMTRYGIDFACAVSCGNIHGVQFHPEKSHHFGERLLQRFADL
jgi:glutamine amidotransferase